MQLCADGLLSSSCHVHDSYLISRQSEIAANGSCGYGY